MRVALITGGASGLGLASARRLAQDGLTVAIADLKVEAAAAAAARLPGRGHLGLAIDVTSETSIAAAFDAVQRQLGSVVVLACFAGILSTSQNRGRVPTIDNITMGEWDRVMEVNARGTFLCAREMLRRTREPIEHGRIVTIASLAGQVGNVQSGAAYSASKGAVLALSKVMAREAAPLGITVNTIAPGPIDTPMLHRTVPSPQSEQKYLGALNVPVGRIGLPEEIAAAVSYVVSTDAGFVTGATIDVNGGLLMR